MRRYRYMTPEYIAGWMEAEKREVAARERNHRELTVESFLEWSKLRGEVNDWASGGIG